MLKNLAKTTVKVYTGGLITTLGLTMFGCAVDKNGTKKIINTIKVAGPLESTKQIITVYILWPKLICDVFKRRLNN